MEQIIKQNTFSRTVFNGSGCTGREKSCSKVLHWDDADEYLMTVSLALTTRIRCMPLK